MALDKFYLTAAGYDLLAKAQIGTALKFTRAQIGEGVWADGTTYANITALVGPIMYFPIVASKVESGGQLKVTIQFSNSGIGRKFDWTEFGLWAADPEYPDDRSKDILYGTSYAGEEPVPIAAALTEFKYNVILKVQQAENVTVEINESLVYLTQNQLGASGGIPTLDENGKIPMEQISAGVPNGVATLDDDGKISGEQLPEEMPDGWKPSVKTVDLIVGNWAGESNPYSQTVEVNGVSADNMAQVIQIVPAIVSQEMFKNAGVSCVEQLENGLRFTSKQKPNVNLTVHIIIQEVASV